MVQLFAIERQRHMHRALAAHRDVLQVAFMVQYCDVEVQRPRLAAAPHHESF
jgi:hypothetical protein